VYCILGLVLLAWLAQAHAQQLIAALEPSTPLGQPPSPSSASLIPAQPAHRLLQPGFPQSLSCLSSRHWRCLLALFLAQPQRPGGLSRKGRLGEQRSVRIHCRPPFLCCCIKSQPNPVPKRYSSRRKIRSLRKKRYSNCRVANSPEHLEYSRI